MRLVTFRRALGAPAELGALMDGGLTPLNPLGLTGMVSTIEQGAPALAMIADYLSRPGHETLPLGGVKLCAPILRPPKIICIGLNYRDHAEESNMAIPTRPTVFAKFATSIIGPEDEIVLPKASTQPDYEAELAVVIGKRCRYVRKDDWRDVVFGYTIVHDVSARDFQLATSQWIMGKVFDTFCPMGPCLVTADEIADPHALDIKLSIGGEMLQNSNTRHLIFDIPTLIEHLSSVFTLEPGDVISTGTPAGVGFARKPPRYLKAGDYCTVYVEGIGELRNPVVAEA